MTRRANNSGYVLVLVLVVLAVGGTLLAMAARRCGQDAIRAGGAQRDLQLKWGRLSCQSTVLPVANLLLQEQDRLRGPGEPIRCEARGAVTLGGLTFRLIVGDENAKANVNQIGLESPGEDSQASQSYLLQRLFKLQADDPQPLTVRLRPLAKPLTEDPAMPVRYPTFDHVLAIQHPSELVGDPRTDGPAVRRRLTCWGSGQLSVQRADPATIQEFLGKYLTNAQIARLDEARKVSPFDLQAALGRMQLTKDQRDRIAPLLTNASGCYSLWIVAQGKDRAWYRLCVSGGGNVDSRQWVLDW